VLQNKEGPVEDPVNNPMNFDLSNEQWDFIFKFYPEYGAGPYMLMTWIFGQATTNEELIA
jgi:hypothetical protein